MAPVACRYSMAAAKAEIYYAHRLSAGARAALPALGAGAVVQQAQAARADDAVDNAVNSVTEVVKVCTFGSSQPAYGYHMDMDVLFGQLTRLCSQSHDSWDDLLIWHVMSPKEHRTIFHRVPSQIPCCR